VTQKASCANLGFDGDSFLDEDSLYAIRRYITAKGRDLFQDWFEALRDPVAKKAVVRRLNRVELGNFGDHKFCGQGVWELRIDVGAGYRIYYALSGQKIILLLCAGDKRTQQADIDCACTYWHDWQGRIDDER
jgi:putative addiction module killer protein